MWGGVCVSDSSRESRTNLAYETDDSAGRWHFQHAPEEIRARLFYQLGRDTPPTMPSAPVAILSLWIQVSRTALAASRRWILNPPVDRQL